MKPGTRIQIFRACRVFISTGILLLTGWSYAAGPNTITYQGTVVRADGNPPADGSYGMRFTLFDAAGDGSQVWQEAYTAGEAVPVSEGCFSAELGSATSIPVGLFKDNPNLWLEVEVDVDNDGFEAEEIYSPRTPMTSSAYSFHSDTATEADILDGKHGSEFASSNHAHSSLEASDGNPTGALVVDDDGDVAVGAATPEFKLTLEGDGGIIAKGTYNSGRALTTTGRGSKLIWYPKKAAFRAGHVWSDYWDEANIGDRSVAMGQDTKASGVLSTAMGAGTIASGACSAALGENTTAQASHSFTLGRFGIASGSSTSWVATDPLFVICNGANPFATNNAVTVLKNGDVGIGAATPEFKLTLDNDGGIIAKGTYSSGKVLTTTGAGSKLIWYPRKAAFRAGAVDADQWNDSSIGIYSTAMGCNTRASNTGSTAMGYVTTASGAGSTAMGTGSTASGYCSTAMGYWTTASGGGSTAMCTNTTASGAGSTAMGYLTTASGDNSTAMGSSTQATGNYSTATGQTTTAQASHSFTLGRFGTAAGSATSWVATDPLFVICNGTSPGAPNNAVTILKNGNVGIGVSAPTHNIDVVGGAYCDGPDWHSVSDRNEKENLAPVDSREVLEKVVSLPVSTWNYKSQDPNVRHIGPMAQDIHAAMGLGGDDKSISAIDGDGISFAAIQGLYQVVQEKDARINSQQKEIDSLRSEIENLKALVRRIAEE